MTIGQKIKRVREFKNYTQEHLAEKLGMSVAGYGKIERDDTDIPFSRLEQISSVLGLKPEELISFDEKMVLNIMNNQTGINNFYNNKTSDKERELYEKTIKSLEEQIALLRKVN